MKPTPMNDAEARNWRELMRYYQEHHTLFGMSRDFGVPLLDNGAVNLQAIRLVWLEKKRSGKAL